MKAMIYENFMRMVYRCGRNCARGTDADIYRKMQHALWQQESPETSTKSRDTLEYEARVAISEVRGYVDSALKRTAVEIYDIEDRQKLGELLLNIPAMQYDPEAIDNTIMEATEILKKHDFRAG
jgi:hypothetical protein